MFAARYNSNSTKEKLTETEQVSKADEEIATSAIADNEIIDAALAPLDFESKFSDWLEKTEGFSQSARKKMITALHKGEEFALRQDFSTHSLLDGNKTSVFVTALMLRKDFDFQSYDYHHACLCHLALSELQKYYGAFVAETEKIKTARLAVEREETDDIFAETADAFETEQTDILQTDETKQPENDIPENWIRVTAYNAYEFSGTVPVYCKVGKYRIYGKSWAKILIEIAEQEKDTPALQRLYHQSLNGQTTHNPFYLTDKIDGIHCVQLSNGYWINVNRNLKDLVNMIYRLCQLAGYSDEEISLYGVQKGDACGGKQANLEQSAEIKPDYDFTQFVGTVPVECKIGEHRLFGNKWADILTEIAEIEKDNPALQRLYYESINGKTTCNPFFLKEKAGTLHCKQLSNGYWINVNHSIPCIVQQIYKLCELCGYRKDEIALYSAPKKAAQVANSDNYYTADIAAAQRLDDAVETDEETYGNRIAEPTISLPVGNQQVERILLENFPNGIRLRLPLDIRRFKHCFAEKFGEEYSGDKDALRAEIAKLCIIVGDYAKAVASLISVPLAEDIVSYLNRQFAKGEYYVHYDALYDMFKDRILQDGLKESNGNILRQCLQIVARGYFCYALEYVVPKSGNNASNSIYDRVADCIRDYGFPIRREELYQKLPNMSRKVIDKVITKNRKEFINDGSGFFFYYDMFSLSEEEKECVENIIERLLSVKNSISGEELLEAIEEKNPNIIADNSVFSPLGKRNVLKYYFEHKYSFRGNVISKYSVSASVTDMFAEFCKENLPFDIDALKTFAESLGSVVYYDTVYDNSLRISQREFVRKENARFDVDATDKAIECYMQSRQYMPLSEIKHFAAFPYAGYVWNEFLLEHYVYAFSSRFKLIHAVSFAQNAVAGGIVYKSADINSFDELSANALADCAVALNKEEAIDWLKNNGYMLRRAYSNIDTVLIKAQELRNKRRAN